MDSSRRFRNRRGFPGLRAHAPAVHTASPPSYGTFGRCHSETLLSSSYRINISKHNAVRFDGIVQVPNCDVYLMKHSSDIMIMVKKPLWKNYIAVTKIYLEDSWGNTFSSDYYFTVSDDLKFCSKTLQDIPKEIIQEFHNELIENSTAIKETIDRKIREEYYKEN